MESHDRTSCSYETFRPVGSPPPPTWCLLVVEVSDTTLPYDKNVKLPRYQAAEVPEVWMLNLQSDTVEVHSDPGTNAYREAVAYGRGRQVESATLPNLTFDADEVLPPGEPEAGG